MKITTLCVILGCFAWVGFMADAETEKAIVYFERGVQFYNSGNYEDALKNFNQAIELAGAEAEFLPLAHLYRGMIEGAVHQNGYAAVMDYHAYLNRTHANRGRVFALLAPTAFNQGMIFRRLLFSTVNLNLDLCVRVKVTPAGTRRKD